MFAVVHKPYSTLGPLRSFPGCLHMHKCPCYPNQMSLNPRNIKTLDRLVALKHL